MFCNLASHVAKITQNITTRQYSDSSNYKPCSAVVAVNDLKRFVSDCFYASGATEFNSEVLADAIAEADYRGVFSEGVLRLEQYIEDIRDHICDPKAQPTIEEEFISVAVVNGHNGLGPVVGTFSMDLAMEKAFNTGIGMVAAKGSNYYGMASLYTIQAARKGFIGLSFSNGIPQMVPPGGVKAALGANPLSLAAPAHCEHLVVDMSTTAVTLSKIEEFKQKKWDIPIGWALNRKGAVEEDPNEVSTFQLLSPLGGDQKHKGYGLALLVEVMSGLLSDSNCGPNISNPKLKYKKEPLNLGHGFIAINPGKFVPNFATRLSRLLNQLRGTEAVDPKQPVMVPGEQAILRMKKVDCEGGICYSKDQMKILDSLSKELKIRRVQISQPDVQVKQSKKKS